MGAKHLTNNSIIMSKSAGESMFAPYKYLAVFCFGGFMQEIWKDIEGYEGLYQVSNLGKIRSFIKCNAHPNVPRIIKAYKHNSGYLRVDLTRDKNTQQYLLHRLVADAFIPKQESKPCINHIDGNKQNNAADNLEWVTYSENQQHAFSTGLKHPKYGKEHHNHSIVNQYTLSGEFIKQWFGFGEIERVLKFSGSNIHACCKGRQKTSYGYIWRYANE